MRATLVSASDEVVAKVAGNPLSSSWQFKPRLIRRATDRGEYEQQIIRRFVGTRDIHHCGIDSRRRQALWILSVCRAALASKILPGRDRVVGRFQQGELINAVADLGSGRIPA